VAAVLNTSVDTALNDLTEAIHEGMVSRFGDFYVFHHDRIYEAAYSLVGEQEKAVLHYRIGNILLASADEKDLPNKLFYIVDQLNLGVAMIRDPDYGRNLSFHRMMVRDARHLTVRVVEGRGTDTAWRKAPEGLPIAVCIGLPPHVLLAAAMSPPKGADECGIAQALDDTPLARAVAVPWRSLPRRNWCWKAC